MDDLAIVGTDDVAAAGIAAIQRVLDVAFADRFDESDRALADEIGARHGVGVLAIGESGFDERLGWRCWLGPTFVRSSSGHVVRTPDEDDGIMVSTTVGTVDRRAAITCSERAGDDR